ncbi:hypothetical protein P7C70_g4159, partial [Phenoliferia sp. Uapishka_3]
MPSKALVPVFLFYAGAAFYLLAVVSLGENKAGVTATARCDAGLVRNVYTGMRGLDGIVCLLVSFFDSAMKYPNSTLFLQTASAILAAPIVIILLEASRPNVSPIIRWSAFATGTLCQIAGGAIALPLWMAVYSFTSSPGEEAGSKNQIRTIIPAFTTSYFGFAVLAANPGSYLTHDAEFIASAFWQGFPLWTAISQFILSCNLPPTFTTARAEKGRTLTFFITLNTMLHWGVLYKLYGISRTTGKAVSDVLWALVDLPLHPATQPEACHLFLLFDLAIITLTTFTFIVFTGGEETPANAILAGQEPAGQKFYVARGAIEGAEGSFAPGKFGETTGRGVLYPYGGNEVYSGKYELLVGDESAINWHPQSGALKVDGLNLVDGGKDADGTPLYVGCADYEGGSYPGKASAKFEGLNIGYGGKEVNVNDYRILSHV